MNKADVGAVLAAVLAVLSSIAVMARDYASKAFEYLRASFVALVSSKAAWAAVIATAVTAFMFGHWAGADGKRALRHEVATLSVRVKSLQETAKETASREAKAHLELNALKQTVEAQTAELARLGQKPAVSAPVAGEPRKAAPKAPQKKPAASEPVRAWSPWNS